MKLYYSLFALLLIIFSCSNSEDDEPTLKITPEQIELLHNGSEKTWRVVEVYEDYSNERVDERTPCIIDDTYTFRANTSEVEMTLGEESCFWEDPDSQATMLSFSYNPESGKAFLSHGRFESKGNSSSGESYYLELEEVSANRLLFANGTAPNFRRALVLEAID